MTDFTTHTIESAPEGSKAGLEAAQKSLGFVPNLLATFAEAPAALDAYNAISGIFDKSSLSAVEGQTVLIAASVENSCEYCVAAHSVIAKNSAGADAATVEALRNGEALPDAKLNALAEFTRVVVRERGFVSEQQLNAFLDAGYTKANALEVIVGIAQKTLSNYTNHLTGISLDEQFASEAWSSPTRKAA